MSLKKFVLDRKGVHALLNSPEIEEVCVRTAAEVAARAGEGYTAAEPHRTGQRVAVNVYADSKEARRDNLENNTLLKVIS